MFRICNCICSRLLCRFLSFFFPLPFGRKRVKKAFSSQHSSRSTDSTQLKPCNCNERDLGQANTTLYTNSHIGTNGHNLQKTEKSCCCCFCCLLFLTVVTESECLCTAGYFTHRNPLDSSSGNTNI